MLSHSQGPAFSQQQGVHVSHIAEHLVAKLGKSHPWDPQEVWGCKVGYVILFTSYNYSYSIVHGRDTPTNMTGPHTLTRKTVLPIDPNSCRFPQPYTLAWEAFKVPSLVAAEM